MNQEKKKFTWNYAIHGMFTLMPMFISQIAETQNEAREKVLAKLGSDAVLFDPPKVEEHDS